MDKLVVFWTDALVFLLFFAVIGLILRIRSKEHLRRPWRKVVTNKVGMVSAVVLGFFLLIGLTDTIHFKPRPDPSEQSQNAYSSEPLSLFDWWVAPLRTREEKTYSAPFAWRLYAKENIVSDDGQKVWGYPRLKYGAAHLSDPPSELSTDLAKTGLLGAAKGLGIFTILVVFFVVLRSWRVKVPMVASWAVFFGGGSETPWRAMLITLMVLVVGSFAVAELSFNYHVLGTDKVGQDVLYQSLKSIRTGIVIGTLTTLVMLPFALVLGIFAGYYRGWVDDVIQYIYTTLNSIPGVLLIAASILVVQVYMANHQDDFANIAVRADTRLLFLCMILGLTSWTGLCRLLRAETMKLREMEYVQAAKALGVRNTVILARHILPNVFHIVLISVVLDFSGLVLAEAVLSYVNIGVDPTTNSWGNMINSARLEMAREPIVWWSLVAAFLFMFTLVLAANLFADAVRDAFDPRRAQ